MVPFILVGKQTYSFCGVGLDTSTYLHLGIQLLECPFFTQHGDVTNDGRNALHVAAQAGQGRGRGLSFLRFR